MAIHRCARLGALFTSSIFTNASGRPQATGLPTSTQVWLTSPSIWKASGSPTPGSAWAASPRSPAGRSHDRGLPAVVGLADGGQWRRVGTEPVCLDDGRLAGALRTLLDLGDRGVHPTPQKTSLTIWRPISDGRPWARTSPTEQRAIAALSELIRVCPGDPTSRVQACL